MPTGCWDCFSVPPPMRSPGLSSLGRKGRRAFSGKCDWPNGNELKTQRHWRGQCLNKWPHSTVLQTSSQPMSFTHILGAVESPVLNIGRRPSSPDIWRKSNLQPTYHNSWGGENVTRKKKILHEKEKISGKHVAYIVKCYEKITRPWMKASMCVNYISMKKERIKKPRVSIKKCYGKEVFWDREQAHGNKKYFQWQVWKTQLKKFREEKTTMTWKIEKLED